MNSYTPINALEPTPSIEQIFMIEEASQRFAGNRKPYVVLKLRDVTGYIKCHIWNTRLNATLSAGKFIIITGKIETYSDELQVNVKSWQPFQGTPENLSDYVYCPNQNILRVYFEELEGFIDSIEDSDYRNIVRNACDRLNLTKRISESPYGFDGRLAYRGGLLMHSVYLLRTILKLFESFSDARHELSRDLLIAGVLFRDIGWWAASESRGNIFVANNIANMLGVRFASAMVTNHTCLHVESDMQIKIDLNKKLYLQQIAFADHNTPNLIPEAELILRAETIVDNVEFTI